MKSETRNPQRVLIAEDEPSIVLSLEFLLQGAGYEVTTARDGTAALRMAESTRPDLIVLDIMLPLLDGFEVCRQIRANALLGHTRILMLTARGHQRAVEKSLTLGADAYMTKPFSTRELVLIINELLSSPAA
ncbi:MAG: response regulator [Burkholderiales bacterium]|nr:response regulator [Burkholderiales bacterium]